MKIEDFKNPAITEVYMLLGSNSKKKAIIFEGNSDVILWCRHIDFNNHGVSIVEAQGKEEVLSCVADALSAFPNRAIGIVDRDYGTSQRLKLHDFNGILSSSLNDIELDILSLGQFTNCLEPSLSMTNLQKLSLKAADLERLATNLAAAVGGMRKLNYEGHNGLDFKCYELKARDLEFGELPEGQWFNAEKIINKYLDKDINKEKIKNKKEFIEQSIQIYDETNEKVNLCRGHDVSQAISILYNYYKKSQRSHRNGNDINDLILGHVTSEDFSNLAVYQDLMDWLN